MTIMEIINLVSPIVGMVTGMGGLFAGIAGMVSGFSAKADNKARIASEYLAAMHDPDFIAARKHVYHQHREEHKPFSVEDEQAVAVINFYHTWGTLARRGCLPMWVFEDRMSGPGAMRLYNILKDLIDDLKEKHNDETYANGYVWLNDRLEKLYAEQRLHPKRVKKLLPSK